MEMSTENHNENHVIGAQALVRSLVDLGVTHVFGYTGAAILPVMDALGSCPIQIVVNSNEQSAAFSAAGYSRSSDEVGVVVVTSGPAITNTLTAVADSYADSVPLLVISGQVPEHKIGTDSFQHIDVASVFGPTAKKVYSLNLSDDIEAVVKESYFLARAGKPGPVVIDMPLNVQQAQTRYSGFGAERFAGLYSTESHLSDAQCAQFFDVLTRARRPLLYVGGGLCSAAGHTALDEFNRRFHLPSVNTLMAKGVVDEDDPMAMTRRRSARSARNAPRSSPTPATPRQPWMTWPAMRTATTSRSRSRSGPRGSSR